MSNFDYLGDHITADTVRSRLADMESELEDSPDCAESISEEIEALRTFLNEIPEDETLIAEESFEDHARDLAEDIYGKELRDSQWPFSCIDWEQAADQLRHDYSAYEYDGTTYYARS